MLFVHLRLDTCKNSFVLSTQVFKRLKQYTSDPDFLPDKVKQVSNSCKSICQWVLALEHYHNVFKMVKPKQKRVDEAKEALNLAQSHLHKKQTSLQKVILDYLLYGL